MSLFCLLEAHFPVESSGRSYRNNILCYCMYLTFWLHVKCLAQNLIEKYKLFSVMKLCYRKTKYQSNFSLLSNFMPGCQTYNFSRTHGELLQSIIPILLFIIIVILNHFYWLLFIALSLELIMKMLDLHCLSSIF